MYNLTPTKHPKPLIISGRDRIATGHPQRAFRCGAHGDKGRKTRGENNRKAIREQF